MSHADSFDYIVIGAGTAGCTIASRLSENPDISVLLVEAGPADTEMDIHMPAAFPRVGGHNHLTWSYASDAESWLNGRRLSLKAGRVLGGSTSVNSMEFVRATAGELDQWAQHLNDTNWSYQSVLPYFKRSESHGSINTPYRGTTGPVQVQQGACTHPLHKAFIEAGEQAGHPVTHDLNGYQQEGVGPLDMMVNGGQRCSVAGAYLHDVMKRSNLQIELNAVVSRVRFVNGRVDGIDYHRDNWDYRATARQEVIVCCGAINSPPLLQRSGIGDPAELSPLGIDIVADSTGVGRHLQDPLQIAVQMNCRQPITLSSSLSFIGKTRALAQWRLTKSGPWASSHFESGGLLRTQSASIGPDVFCQFIPLATEQNGQLVGDGHTFQLQSTYMRPTSEGFVRLRSAEPNQPPRIVMDYLSTENDRSALREVVRLSKDIIAQAAFSVFRGTPIAPGKNVETDSELDAFIRENAVSSGNPCGTCRMGPDELSVVDNEFRVLGVDGLRVADASVVPALFSGSAAATGIMLAEKAADLILGKDVLPPADVDVAQINPLVSRNVA